MSQIRHPRRYYFRVRHASDSHGPVVETHDGVKGRKLP